MGAAKIKLANGTWQELTTDDKIKLSDGSWVNFKIGDKVKSSSGSWEDIVDPAVGTPTIAIYPAAGLWYNNGMPYIQNSEIVIELDGVGETDWAIDPQDSWIHGNKTGINTAWIRCDTNTGIARSGSVRFKIASIPATYVTLVVDQDAV